MDFYHYLPAEGAKILLVLFLSFLTGLEREEHRAGKEGFSFGGVRTFPLIGLTGYAISLLSGGQVLPVAIGLAVVAGFLMLSYQHKLTASGLPGITSEMSALMTYVVGVLVHQEQFWIATSLSIASVLLLELKSVLEGLSQKIAANEIFTFTKFLLLTAVILPALPNQEFGPFQINPAKVWLVVVAVSAVSYGSYVIQILTKGQGGVILAALLGGAYSSTATTVALAKQSLTESRPRLLSGATLIASGVTYLRLGALVAVFNRNLMAVLGPPFLALAGLGMGAGWLWTRVPAAKSNEEAKGSEPKNPLELSAAFLFALVFVAVLVITHLAIDALGKAGVYTLAALVGVTDVTPFVMGMTQSAGQTTAIAVASAAILISAASNNIVKAIYAYTLSERQTGRQSFWMLIGLAAANLIPLIWLAA
jgi:uncharacterized membrane protein (DUF4010 family)